VVAAAVMMMFALLLALTWGLLRLSEQNRRLSTWQSVTGIVQSSKDRPAEALGSLVDVARGEELPQIREALHTVLRRTHETWRRSRIVPARQHSGDARWPTEVELGVLYERLDEDRFLTTSTWGYIYVHDLATGAELSCVRSHETAITAIALSPDHRTLVTADYAGDVRWHQLNNLGGQPIATRTFPGRVWALAFRGDGARLAIAYGTQPELAPSVDIQVLQLTAQGIPDATPTLLMQGHLGQVNQLAFSANGKHLASLGEVPAWHALT